MNREEEIRKEIIALINREVVPAMGCTEPIAIAYSASIARSYLSKNPTEIRIGLSGNIIKNTNKACIFLKMYYYIISTRIK